MPLLLDGADASLSFEWILGTSFGVLATLLGSLSKILWRLSHVVNNKVKDLPEDDEYRTVAKRKASCIWFTGTGCLVLNPPADVAAFALAPQSVVSATSGSASIFNLFFAPMLLGEKVTWFDLVGAVLVAGGCCGVGFFGPKETPEYTFPDIMEFYSKELFHWFVAGQLVFLLFCTLMICCPVHQLLQKLAWGAISGTIGGNYFFAKSMTMLLHYGAAPWSRWEMWATAIMAAVTGLVSVILLNEGLRRYSALFVAPVFQAFLVVSGTMSGAIFFEELVSFPEERLMHFWISLGVVTLGVLFCLFADEDEHSESDEEAYYVPEPIEEPDETQKLGREYENSMLDEYDRNVMFDNPEQAPLIVRQVE